MIRNSTYTGVPDPELQPEFYADIPVKRLIAWVIDTIIIAILAVLLIPFTAFVGLFVFPLLMLAAGFVYRWFTLSRGSATWGMRMVAIEIRTGDGHLLDSQTAAAHTLIYTVAVTSLFLQLVSIGLILGSARRQSLGDHVLGTVALNRAAGH